MLRSNTASASHRPSTSAVMRSAKHAEGGTDDNGLLFAIPLCTHAGHCASAVPTPSARWRPDSCRSVRSRTRLYDEPMNPASQFLAAEVRLTRDARTCFSHQATPVFCG
jgi:hypothetical protein